MYYIDYHCHSQLSPDSTAPLAQMAQAAVAAGIREMCITDHYDNLEADGRRKDPYDWAPAVAQYQRVKAQFAGRLTLKLGLEFGTGYLDEGALTSAPPQLDFVIGSLHNRSAALGGTDYYYGDYEDPAVCYATLEDYITQMEEKLAAAPVYDVLGHIIYPLRYMSPVCREELSMARYMDRIREILKLAIQSGRGMEVNSYRGGTIEDWRPVLQQFKDCGGEILTVGSDAHRPESMAKGVKEAYALLQSMGFRYVTTFSRRKPSFVKL